MTIENPLDYRDRDLRDINAYLQYNPVPALLDATGAELFHHRILLERWLDLVNTELHRRYPGFGEAGAQGPRPISMALPTETLP